MSEFAAGDRVRFKLDPNGGEFIVTLPTPPFEDRINIAGFIAQGDTAASIRYTQDVYKVELEKVPADARETQP